MKGPETTVKLNWNSKQVFENDPYKLDQIVDKCRIRVNYYDQLKKCFKNDFLDLIKIDCRDTYKFKEWHEQAKREISLEDSRGQSKMGTVNEKFKDDLLNSLLLNEVYDEIYDYFDKYKQKKIKNLLTKLPVQLG